MVKTICYLLYKLFAQKLDILYFYATIFINMKGILLGLQIISAIALVATVLLHTAKGEGLGGIGGHAKIFGTQKGLEEGLDRITATCAIFFVLISIVLAIVGT